MTGLLDISRRKRTSAIGAIADGSAGLMMVVPEVGIRLEGDLERVAQDNVSPTISIGIEIHDPLFPFCRHLRAIITSGGSPSAVEREEIGRLRPADHPDH